MTKLTRKLFISILTVAFAVVTLGATTFAWFTLNNTADIKQFNLQVSAGTGIQISLDNENFYSSIRKEDIENKVKNMILNHVTTTNGRDMNMLVKTDGNYGYTTTTDGYVIFPVYFRSPQQGVNIHLLQDTKIGSKGVEWISDAQFTGADGIAINEYAKSTYYAANALRMSFTSFTSTDNSFTESENTLIYELNPTLVVTDPSTYNNQRLDSQRILNGAIDYYRVKTGDNLIDKFSSPELPTVVLNYDNLVESSSLTHNATLENSLVTLTQKKTVEGTVYYYGMINIRMWLEGWDPDCFNAILQDIISVYLKFGGHTIDPTIELQDAQELTIDTTLQLTPTIKFGTSAPDYVMGVTYESDLPGVATVDSNGLITAVSAGVATITATLVDYPTVATTITITVPAA